jgi:hypothetical protein
MSVNPVEQNPQQQQPAQEQKQSDKEYNFAQIRKQLEQERIARQQAEEKAAQLMQEHAKLQQSKASVDDDDDGDDEPYIDKRRLKKELGKVVKQTNTETDTKIQNAVQSALAEERKNMWLKSNPDFYEVMGHAQTFAEKDPELAETILSMPDNFERQKLVYKNIKALGIHKKEDPKSSIQETVNKNQRSPYYQPSGMGTAPYGIVNGGKDYTPAEGKAAFDKMKELQRRLRLG